MPRPKKDKKPSNESQKERRHLKIKKICRNSRVFPDFNGFFRILPHICCVFAPFPPYLAVFLRCFCCVFALSSAVDSPFLLYFAIPSRLFHCFFVGFRFFFPLFSHFFRFLGYLPRLAHDFSAVVFLFYRFSSGFLVFYRHFCPP